MSEKQYRYLETGEMRQKGDLAEMEPDVWVECTLVGIIQDNECHRPIRRPITSSPEGEKGLCKHGIRHGKDGFVCETCEKEESSPTTEPVVTEKHQRAACELWMLGDKLSDPDEERARLILVETCAKRIAKHFPEPASDWIERAAEEIEDSADRWIDSIKSKEIIAAIITRHMKGEGA